jgi:hypothetical protein
VRNSDRGSASARSIFDLWSAQMGDATEVYRAVRGEALHKLHSSPNINTMIETKAWDGRVM